MIEEKPKLLEVDQLRQHFPVRGGVMMKQVGAVKAVDGVSFSIAPGETLGLVGESGCGKSTLGKAVVRLLKPTSGRVSFKGRDITSLRQGRLRKLRRDFQMVFQDPAESLDARMSVGELIAEPLVIQGLGNRGARQKKVAKLLDRVGLPRNAANKFPFEFSGGQRQRIGIARALAAEPKFIICDEVTSALDQLVAEGILKLLARLQDDLKLSYMFIWSLSSPFLKCFNSPYF